MIDLNSGWLICCFVISERWMQPTKLSLSGLGAGTIVVNMENVRTASTKKCGLSAESKPTNLTLKI